MEEYDIAVKKVYPYLKNKLKWPDNLISNYGRVPVQMGTETRWADYVCYISRDQRLVPWVLIEVKKTDGVLELEAIQQAESYSLMLDIPFFGVADGDRFQFYITGKSQGESIPIQKTPPRPHMEYLKGDVEHIYFNSGIDNLVDLFMQGLKSEKKFYKDTVDHYEKQKMLFKSIFMQIDSLSSWDIKNIFGQYMMIKIPNRKELFKQIDDDIGKIKEILKFIRDFKGDSLNHLNRLLDRKGDFYLKGGGIFFITQLFAAAHLDEYIVLEENISKALKWLDITDVLIKNDTANAYIYINEMCKKLYKEKFEQKLKENGFDFRLIAVHNFLWHYYRYFRVIRKWCP